MTIDKTKLKCNYDNKIYRYGEKIDKDDLYYLYKELNLSIKDVANVLNTKTSRVEFSIKYYGFKKNEEDVKESKRNTSIRRYGVAYASQSKWFRDSVKKTCKQKYGVENISQASEVKEKKENTCLKHYGVTNPSKAQVVKDKKLRTVTKNYGVHSPLLNKEYASKLKKDHLEKFGCVCKQQEHIQNKEIWFSDKLLADYVALGNPLVSGWIGKYSIRDLCKKFNVSKSTAEKRIRFLNLWDFIKTESCVEEGNLRECITSFGLETTKYRERGLEVDIFVKDSNIGIEYNGNYWHSYEVRGDKNYHINKSNKALARGIFIYHLFEHEWFLNREKILGQLKNLFNKNNYRVYARKCTVCCVNVKEAREFLNRNHVQGYVGSSVYLGLYNSGELVALMTFGKPRFSKQYEWELVRFCCKLDTTVVGGASKLFKYFIKNYNPNSIVSYSDIAKTRGTMYAKLGFTEIGVTKPNYVWSKVGFNNTISILSRYQCQKHLLVKDGYSPDKTEVEIMHERRYKRVYDCGNRIHLWNKKDGSDR